MWVFFKDFTAGIRWYGYRRSPDVYLQVGKDADNMMEEMKESEAQ